ncbi:RNA 3'-terminal phosphate cyclase-like protein isoform X3 [Numida meleagris]|uniref:RNA 3'-terminal phosphate cyclase-like protein isoform X3 n=1 Tax=Numida meleagris TaxID=8996 RepID=UPI000B3E09E9|nr:RNA 3'-terminal phosphate cyclase-like protein isoform X3 [Numida meleagris]
MAGGGGAQCLSYAGCNFLRQRLVLSTLSGRPLKIRKIRAKEEDPGLRGTTLYYQPGLLYGGSLEHDCSPSRSIGYYLESLLCLAPFMKHPLKIVLRGVTNDQVDPSVDVLKATALPLLKKFGIDGESLEIKINRRGMPPKGGGEILFACPVRKVLQPIQFTDPGKIKRIRGTAYSVRVSPQMANRMVESARSVLNKFLPDIYIYTDHMKGISSGNPCRRICNSMGRKDEFPFPHWWCMSISTAAVLPYSASPGFGICLIAETINGTILSAELASNPQGQGAAVLPEELGQNCAKLLLEEIYRGGCVDSTNQSLALLLMTLGQQDVSKVLLGPLSPYTIEFLRHLRSFFQIMFKIEMKSPEEERKGGEKVLMTCVGIGFSNLSKTIR